MIRQTKNYLVGALSGATLIGIAIAAFVVIVSAQVFHDWPIAGIGGGSTKSGVAAAKDLGSTAGEVSGGEIAVAVPNPASHARAAGRPDAGATPRHRATKAPDRAVDVSGSADPVDAPSEATEGDESSAPSAESGSQPSQSTSSPAPSSSGGNSSAGSNSSSGVGNASGTSGGSSGGGPTVSGGSSGTGVSGGAGGTTVETPVATAKVPPVSETVNETVHEVDEAALGGTLEEAGVTEVTESVVEGVVGSETPIGKTVEGTTEAVGGLLGGGGSGGQ